MKFKDVIQNAEIREFKLSDFDKLVLEELENYDVLNVEGLCIKLSTKGMGHVCKDRILMSCVKLQILKLCTIWSENKVKINRTWIQNK